jgi:hypothetical protein
MKDKLFLFLLLIAVSLLAACDDTSRTSNSDSATPVVTENETTLEPDGSTGFPTRNDEQGSVTFAVAPLNLDAPGETIDFEVTMDTHSVELSWDLAAQSTLTTDAGRQVVGTSWPGGSGHHVVGTLSFPAQTADGDPLLAGANTVTLTIRDAGAAARTFEWMLD